MKSRSRDIIRILVITTLSSLSSAHAQPGTQLWVQRYDGAVNGDDRAAAIAVDGSGNVVVTGYSVRTSGFVTPNYLTVKYSSAGVPLWTNRYNGPANYEDEAQAVAVDTNGNVFVTGYSFANTSDYATIKYSSAGVPLWTNRYAQGKARAIAVDRNGDAVVTGYSFDTSPNDDYVTIKYSNTGVPVWTNRYNGPANGRDQANAITVDSNGSVFVTGYSQGDTLDYATLKYSSAGVPLWTNRYSSGGAMAIALDGSGNVFVTGYSSADTVDYATIKYSNDGLPLWTNRYDGPGNGDDYPHAMAVDGSGNVVVTGYSNSNFNDDYATIKYSGAGVPVWTNLYDGPGDGADRAFGIATDGRGNVFVTGLSYDSSNAQDDCTTIAYSSAGVPLWTNRYDGPSGRDDAGFAIAVDSGGNVFVTGFSTGDTNYGYADYLTIKYSSMIVPPARLDIQQINNKVSLTWTNTGFSLQSAPAATGPFMNIPGATSPYTNLITGPQQFFRLISP